jgi:ABC-2 type transport system permease protein
MNLLPLLTKELRELAKSYKLLFVPVVFIVLGIGQPLAYKLMPYLLGSAGNMPQSILANLPAPDPGEVVAACISQFNQLGILLVILCAMGAIAGERASGVAATVLTKPVGRGEYLLSKAIAYTVLAVVSLFLGLFAGAFYTWLLIGPVDWMNVTLAFLLYLPNLLLAASVSLFFSAFLPSGLAAGGAALVAVVGLNTVPKYFGKVLSPLFPGALTEKAASVLMGASPQLVSSLFGVCVLALVFLAAGWQVLRTQEI